MFPQIIRILSAVLLCFTCTVPALAENLLPTTLWSLDGRKNGIQEQQSFYLQVLPHADNQNAVNMNAANAGKRSYDFILKPSLPGTWTWLRDDTLEFEPEQPWQPDTKYTVTASHNALPSSMQLSPSTFSFQTAPLQPDAFFANFVFDPQNLQEKMINLEASFSYAINPQSMAEALQVEPEKGLLLGAPLFSWNQDNTRMVCTIPVLEIPENSKTVSLALTNAYTAKGSGAAGKPTELQLTVTGQNELFTLNSVQAASATSANMAAEQLLTFDFSLPCTPAEVLSKVKVYLLPRQRIADAANAEKKAPYTWWSTEELTPSVLAEAQALPLNFTTDPQFAGTLVSFSYRAEPGRGLYVMVEPDIYSTLSFQSSQALNTIVTVPPYVDVLTVMQKGGVLTLNGDKKLAVYSRNLDSISYHLAQIRPESINALLANSYGLSTALLYTYADLDTMEIVHEGSIKLNKSDALAPQFSSIDLGPALAGQATAPLAKPQKALNQILHPGALEPDQVSQSISGPGRGLFVLNMQGQRLNAEGKNETVPMDEAGPNRLILVTDLGIIHKVGANGSTAYVVSLSEGKPAANVEVSVLGANGLAVFSGQTDAEGSLRIPDTSALNAEKKAIAIVAQRGDDRAFLPLGSERNLNYSRFDVGGGQRSTGSLNAYVFTQRTLYKPGETLHFGYIVKQENWAELEGIPLEAVLTDIRGNELKRSLKVSADGFGEVSFDLPESTATGSYFFTLRLANPADANDPVILDFTRVEVEDFEPDTQRIVTSLEPKTEKGWLKPEGLRLETTLSNLFGTPAPDRRVKVTMTVLPSSFHFPQYPDWTFYDPSFAKGRQQVQNLPEQRTNAQGQAFFSVPMGQYADTTYNLSLRTEGFDPASGKAVSSIVHALISPLDALMGWKSDANLNFVRQNGQATVELIWVNQNLEAQNSGPLTLETLRSQSVKTLVRDLNGAYVYQNQPQEKLISSTEIEVPATGLSLNLDSTEPGAKVLLVRNAAGQVLSRIAYNVAGNAVAQMDIDKEPGLNMRLNKSDFNPGESMEVALSMPYSGAGLLTLERDQVFTHVWFQAEAGETTQRLTIPENFEGKGFVNATVFRSMTDTDIFSQPVSSAVAPFTSNMAARNMNLSVKAPEVVRPGQVFDVAVKAEKPGKVLVFAVDEGILQISRFTNPNPLKALLGNRALQVETGQYFDLLMPQYSLMSKVMQFGGGDFAGSPVGQNPFRRRNEKSAVFWSGLVELGSDTVNIPMTMPATFSGKLRVLAVSCSPSAVGAASTSALVQAEVVMLPALPIFVAPGDSFEAAVTLTDMSGENRSIRLELLTEAGLRVSSETLPVLKLEYGREQSVRVNMVATDVLGPTTVTLRAVPVADSTGKTPSNTTVVERPVQLSVRPVMPLSVALQMGKAENVADIALDRNLYPQMATVEASISTLPLPMAYAFMNSLNQYPLDCTEQVISAAFPALMLLQNPALSPQGALFSQKALQERVTKTLDTLAIRQDYSGNFSLWPNGGADGTGFVQVYAADFLTTAQAIGLAVPSELINRTLSNVENLCSRVPNSSEQARIQAYGAWVLTRNGRVSSNILATLTSWLEQNQKNWQHDIVAPFMAVCWKMMMQGTQADQLLSAYQQGLTSTKVQPSSSSWLSPTASLSLYLTLIDQSFPEQKSAPSTEAALNTLIDLIQNSNTSQSTLSEALASRALLQWATSGSAQMNTASLEAFDKSKNPLPMLVEASSVALGGSLSGEQAATLGSLRLSAPGAFYWQISSSGFLTQAPTKPIEKGLAVSKYLLEADGQPLGMSEQSVSEQDKLAQNKLVQDKPEATPANTKPAPKPQKNAPAGKNKPALPTGPVLVQQGEELIVVLRAQSYGQRVEQVAITDLLPGGFELILSADGTLAEADLPLGSALGARPMDITAIDRREDRMTVIATLYPEPSVFAYKVRAVSKGDFALPPVQAECMYNSLLYATDALNTLKVN